MDSTQRLQELFSLYRQRHCSPAEVEELIHLLQQADAEEALDTPMQTLWEEFKEHNTEYPVDWDKMYGQVRQVESDLSTLQQQRIGSHSRIRFLRSTSGIAAALLVALAIPAAWWAWSTSHARSPVANKPASVIASLPVKKQTFSPDTERRRILHLPDGSTVILNRNSRLDYKSGLIGATREVTLAGEGFFDIVHVPGRPFLVHTGELTTRVLGTSFNIRAWPADKTVEVTVKKGKVQVLKADSSLGLLTDAQQIRFDESTAIAKRKKVDLAPVLAWRPEEIHFDDLTMGEAAQQLEKRFGRSVQFKNPILKNCRVTATFYEDDGLDEIMTVICGVSQSTYTISDQNITIDGAGCN